MKPDRNSQRQSAPPSCNPAAGEQKRLILFLGADWWGSDARALAAALRRCGHLLIEVMPDDYFPLQWSSIPLRVLRRLGRRLFQSNFNDRVAFHATNTAIDMVLVFKGALLKPETLRAFQASRTPRYCVYPDVSFLDHGPEIAECLPLYDCLFTTKSFHLGDPKLLTAVKKVQLVSHGYDPEVHRPVALTQRMKQSYGCAVSFVGCRSPKKEHLLSTLLKRFPTMDVRIWGPGWERSASIVRKCWQGRGAFGDELTLIYLASKINLGLLSEAGGGTLTGDQVTVRTWQIPAAGGFLLHENTAELACAFEVGVEVAVFSSGEDLPQQVAYYLDRQRERERIQAAGRLRCTTQGYTYDAMADAIIAAHETSVSGAIPGFVTG